ncbi:MAG: hypothetical protein HQM04_06695 [Magnetococcales bacterium]|nr:hypothetical protein [Magnetococcales bacterium]MBF0114715.1 hypothetical protein [Magnetococcales bacterium]
MNAEKRSAERRRHALHAECRNLSKKQPFIEIFLLLLCACLVYYSYTKNDTLDNVIVKKSHTTQNSFGIVLVTESISIENKNPYPIKDITLKCTLSSASGTIISSNQETLFKTIPGQTTVTLDNVKASLNSKESESVNCLLVDVKRAL